MDRLCIQAKSAIESLNFVLAGAVLTNGLLAFETQVEFFRHEHARAATAVVDPGRLVCG